MLIFKVDICTMYIYKVIVPNMRNFTSERSKPGQFISQTGAVHENREFHGGPERGEVLSFPSDIGLTMGQLLDKHGCLITDSGADEVR